MYVIGKHIKTIFYNEKNGFMVGLIKINETDIEKAPSEIVWVGYSLNITENEEYQFWGELKKHPKYGEQLIVNKITKINPKTTNHIVAYLSSDLFPQVGRQTAEKIVTVLGEATIDKILNDEKVLDAVDIASDKKRVIYQNLQKNEQMNQVITQLIDLGFSMAEAVKIYAFFREKTAEIIPNSLYDIYFHLPELGFVKIDNIARAQSIAYDDFYRQCAFFLYQLKDLLFKNGHSYISKDEWIANIKTDDIAISEEKWQECVSYLVAQKQIVVDDTRIYLYDYYYSEVYIADFLRKLKITSRENDLTAECQKVAKANNLIYDETQTAAIQMAVNTPFSLISGGPGTGKSTIIKGIVNLYQEIHGLSDEEISKKVAILAPTGRASKRLRDLTGFSAQTIHRFLKWQKEKDEFLINENNKTDKKVIIIDEASMIDLLLFVNLLKALPSNIKLIMVGDANQLPPVAPGQIFKDLIASNVFPVVFLTKNYRQSKDTFLPKLAELVKNGQLSPTMEDEYVDYEFINCPSSAIMENLLTLRKELANENLFDVQIVAPIYKGYNGIDRINRQIQNVLNNHNVPEVTYHNVVFRQYDKVIQLNNMPENDIFNGDMGQIVQIKMAAETASGKIEVIVDFYGRKITYFWADLYHLKHAYAISIHKAQGSEFKYVIMPLCRSYNRMLYRLLFYTGITRSQKKLILIGEKAMLERAITNEAEIKRNSYLIERVLA